MAPDEVDGPGLIDMGHRGGYTDHPKYCPRGRYRRIGAAGVSVGPRCWLIAARDEVKMRVARNATRFAKT
jgi:hypothetical protein